MGADPWAVALRHPAAGSLASAGHSVTELPQLAGPLCPWPSRRVHGLALVRRLPPGEGLLPGVAVTSVVAMSLSPGQGPLEQTKEGCRLEGT